MAQNTDKRSRFTKLDSNDGLVISGAASSFSSYQIYRSGDDVYWYNGSSSVKMNSSAGTGTSGDLDSA